MLNNVQYEDFKNYRYAIFSGRLVFHNPSLNPLYTGGLFHCYMLAESICQLRGVGSILSLLFYFRWKIQLASNLGPVQMSHYVASDLGLQCLPMTLYGFPGKNGLKCQKQN